MKKPSDSDGEKRKPIQSDLSRFLSGQMSSEELAEKGAKLARGASGVARMARKNMQRLGLTGGTEIVEARPKTLAEAIQHVEEEDVVQEIVHKLNEEIEKRTQKKRRHEDN